MRLKKHLGCAVLLSLAVTSELSGQAGLGGFGGPTVLGRSQQTGRRSGQSARMRAFASANGIYDSGLTTITSNGVSRPTGGAGIETMWGLYGSVENRRGQVGVEYRGDYRYYGKDFAWNGTDQSLALSGTRQITKRIGLEGQALVGTTNRAFSGVRGLTTGGVGDPTLFSQGLGFNSLFDVRTDFGSAAGGLVYMLSPRSSVSVFGTGYTVRRRNRALIGMDGILGRADFAYRLSRNTTLAFDVQYVKFDFRNTFGDSNAIDPGFFLGYRLNRKWEVGVRASIIRLETTATQSVSLAPEIAALLGVNQTVEIFYRKQTIPAFSGLVAWRGRRSDFNAQVQNGIGPGNGIVFTTRQTNTFATYGYKIGRQSTVTAGVNFARLSSATNLAGVYNQYSVGVGYNMKLTRTIDVLARFDRRQSSFSSNRDYSIAGNRIQFGIAYAPGEVPLSIW